MTSFGLLGIGPESVVHADPIDITRGFSRLTCSYLGSSGREATNTATLGNNDFGAQLSLQSATGFELTRQIAAEPADHRYYSETIESPAGGNHGFRVLFNGFRQLGAGVASGTSSALAGITDLSRNFIWPCAVRSGATSEVWSQGAVHAYVDGAGVRQFSRGGSTQSVRLSYVQIEMGLEWTVRRIPISLATRGVWTEFSGAGEESWGTKCLLLSYKTPAGANNLADNMIVRRKENDATKLEAYIPPGAAAGTFQGSAIILHHEDMVVSHWFDGFVGGQNVYEAYHTIPLPHSAPKSRSSAIVQTINTGDILGYYRQGWGYELQDTSIYLRRSRADSTRGSLAYLQAVDWPGGGGGGRNEASVLEAPCWAQ